MLSALLIVCLLSTTAWCGTLQTKQRALSRLDAVQETYGEVSGHVSSSHDADSTLSARLDSLLQSQGTLAGRLDTVSDSQTSLSQRLDALSQSQSVTSDQLAAMQKSLSALSGRVDAIQASQSPISPRFGGNTPLQLRSSATYSQPWITTQLSSKQPDARLSEFCVDQGDCVTPFAVCVRSICSCPSYDFWNDNNTECRYFAREGDSCSDDQPCVSDFTCTSGTCSCPVKRQGDFEYHLTGGTFCNHGRVELRQPGFSWNLVCDDNWSSNDAKVICRSLGFKSGSAIFDSRRGRGIKFDTGANCRGSESNLMQCGFGAWYEDDCVGKVAGVNCSN